MVKVNKKTVIADGKPVRVTATQAETFPTSVIDDYSDPSYFPLPQGTIDYTVGDELIYKDGDRTFSYYKLASGVRVYTKDITAISESEGVGNNSINGHHRHRRWKLHQGDFSHPAEGLLPGYLYGKQLQHRL